MINTVVEAFSGLVILVNNAGIQEECSHELATRDFDNALSIPTSEKQGLLRILLRIYQFTKNYIGEL